MCDVSKSEIVGPVVEMTSLRKMTHQIQQYEKGVSTAYTNITSGSVSIFVYSDIHISFPCKCILSNKPKMY